MSDYVLDLTPQLAKLRADRLRFQGLPQETALGIIGEAVEKLLLLPEAQNFESGAITGIDSLLTVLLEPEIGPLAPVAVKGADYALHAFLEYFKKKAAADIAARQSQGL